MKIGSHTKKKRFMIYEGDSFFQNIHVRLRMYYIYSNGEWTLSKKGELKKKELENLPK